MRWASIVFLVGCTSTRTVAQPELLCDENGEVGDGIAVNTTSMWKSRIDPTSKLRLWNKARESTDWLNADAVHVVPGWIYTWGVVDILEHTERITIAGLEKAELDDLIAARPLRGA